MTKQLQAGKADRQTSLRTSGIVTKAVFSLDVQGNFSFDSSLSPYLELERFNGLTLLKVKGLLPT